MWSIGELWWVFMEFFQVFDMEDGVNEVHVRGKLKFVVYRGGLFNDGEWTEPLVREFLGQALFGFKAFGGKPDFVSYFELDIASVFIGLLGLLFLGSFE